MGNLLEVRNLEVVFHLRFGKLTAINGVSFSLEKGQRLGIVGESGAGKSVTGFAIINSERSFLWQTTKNISTVAIS